MSNKDQKVGDVEMRTADKQEEEENEHQEIQQEKADNIATPHCEPGLAPPSLRRDRSTPGAFPIGTRRPQQDDAMSTITSIQEEDVLVNAELVEHHDAVVTPSREGLPRDDGTSLVFGEAVEESKLEKDAWKIVYHSRRFRFAVAIILVVFLALVFGLIFGFKKSNASKLNAPTTTPGPTPSSDFYPSPSSASSGSNSKPSRPHSDSPEKDD